MLDTLLSRVYQPTFDIFKKHGKIIRCFRHLQRHHRCVQPDFWNFFGDAKSNIVFNSSEVLLAHHSRGSLFSVKPCLYNTTPAFFVAQSACCCGQLCQALSVQHAATYISHCLRRFFVVATAKSKLKCGCCLCSRHCHLSTSPYLSTR